MEARDLASASSESTCPEPSIGLSTRGPYMLSVRPILTLFSFIL